MIKGLLHRLFKSAAAEPAELHLPELAPAERSLILETARQALIAGDYPLAGMQAAVLLRANVADPDALVVEGLRRHLTKDYPGAVACLRKAQEVGVADAQSLKFLASSLLEVGDEVAAVEVAGKALELAPRDAQIVNLLGIMNMKAERYDEAASLFERAIELAPRDLGALQNMVLLDSSSRAAQHKIFLQGRVEQARKGALRRLLQDRKKAVLPEPQARALLRLGGDDPDLSELIHAEAERLYALPLIESETAALVGEIFVLWGDLPRAIEMFECAIGGGAASDTPLSITLSQLHIAQAGKAWLDGWRGYDAAIWQSRRRNRMTQLRLWRGERLGARKLFVYQDQGFGDLLLSLRILKAAVDKGLHLVFWVSPAIAPLLAVDEWGVELVVSKERPDPAALGCVALSPLLRLVHLLKLKPADLKTPVRVTPPIERCESWRSRLASEPKLKIGVALTGNVLRVDDWYRSIPFSALTPLRKIEDVLWVNLAVDARPDRDAMIRDLPMLNPAPDFQDFSDTAALIDALDVVLAIDCSVAHLAAAQGKPVLALVPSSLDWRWWIGNDPHPWWPNARIFRSPAPACWAEVLDAAAAELAVFARERTAALQREL